MKKRLLIGIVAIEPNYERTAGVIEGIIRQAFKSDCDIAVLSSVYHLNKTTNSFRMEEQSIFELILSGRFDGFLYDPRFVYHPDVAARLDKLLRKSGKPVMTIDGGDAHPYFDNTAADDCRPFRKLTEHLIEEHGFTKIYCLTGPQKFPDAVQRLAGYFEAMEKHQLPYEKSWYRYGDFWKDAARELAADILEGKLEQPEAIVCGNDISAKALIDALENGGLRVPEDIAVAGFDCESEDFEADSRITSYRRANFQLGADAFRRLYRTITGGIPARVHDSREGLRLGLTCGCRGITRLTAREQHEKATRRIFRSGLESEDMVIRYAQEQSFPEMLQRITGMAYYLYRMRHFAICLTEPFCQSIEQGAQLRTLTHESEMRIASERFDDGRLAYPDMAFHADDVLPFFGQDKPCAYFLTPLHSENICFGYAALSFGKLPCTYDSTYIRLIGEVNTLLTLFQKRQLGVHALTASQTDPVTGFRTWQAFRPASEYSLVYVEITDFKLLFCQLTPEELHKRLRAFAEILHSALHPDDIACALSPDGIAVFTKDTKLPETLFPALRKGSLYHRLPFTVSEAISPAQSPELMLQQAMLRVQFTYSMRKSSERDALFDKLCQLQADIRSHPEREWRIEDIADMLHISRGHLQKSYKQYFGTGIIETVITLRMERAKELLAGTEQSVTEIAERCGYASYVYFTKQFKHAIGMTPSEYREVHRSGAE